jgi:Icc-related predicted phosphoesterase
MQTIQIASDLHIEYKNNNVPNPLDFITPSADVLILAGDIGSFYKIEQLTIFLEKLCPYFQIVLYVPGNHEWYTIKDYTCLSWETLEKRMLKLESIIPNLTILNRSSVLIGDICFAGCTLWSNPEGQIPPFIVRIHDMRTKEYQNKHNQDLEYLKKMMIFCQKNNHKLVVVTHYPPTKQVLDGVCAKKKKFHSIYATNLDYLLDSAFVKTWVCGHVHKNFDFFSTKGCRIVGNQKGKGKDKIIDYISDFVITV